MNPSPPVSPGAGKPNPFAPRLTPAFSLAIPDSVNSKAPRTVSITMEDYITDAKDENGLDLDMVHDFGAEGLGVDMRDFTNHTEEGEESKEEILNATELATTIVSQGQLTPQPPTSASGMGDVPSSAGVDVDDMFQTETGLEGDDDDDDDGDMTEGPSGKRVRSNEAGGFTYVEKDGEPSRRKIRIEYISDKSRRHITFSKRKAGIMKKAYELSILTGTQVLLLVVSETGLVYTFTTTKLQPLVQKAEGKNLIQACLNAPDGFGPDGQPLGGPVPATKSKNGGLAIRPHKLTAAASAAMAASAQAASEEQQSAAAASAHQHQQNQADAASAIGQGTPVSARPKKRMPSGKKRQASASASSQPQAPPELDIPPVPSIPDIHRQASPHNAHPSSGGLIDPSLHSPMSAGFHIPPEYQQGLSPGGQQTGPGHGGPPPQGHYGYPPPPPPGQEGGYPYYAPPTQQHHHHQQQQQQHQYMNIHHHQQQQLFQQQQQAQRERERMMGMGM
ncbi:pheromone receptor transcription factor [Kwoniella newhampshirensis]|uniref:Pheromone receptor transcription factor n=1 Tax=Kwoniella newhampshirensis TaxID=1651941 RepID=A0AAW0Z1Z9_9TREE